MSYSVRGPIPDEPFVVLVMVGHVDPPMLEEAFREVVVACATNETYHVLTDLTELTGGHSVVDLYGLISALNDLGIADRFREAVVVGTTESSRELARFYETAGVNRGISIQTFPDRDAAVAWLTA